MRVFLALLGGRPSPSAELARLHWSPHRGTFVRGRTATLRRPGARADVVPMFRSRILPAVIAIWGALIVLRLLSNGTSDGAFGGGQLLAGLLGLVMVAAGVRSLLRS